MAFSKLCKKCGRKGLHHPNHPHAFGMKQYDRLICRFCGARYKLRFKKGAGHET